MIPLYKLKTNMIIKYCSSTRSYNPTELIVGRIEDSGPELIDLKGGHSYGIIAHYNYLHKINTLKEQVIKDLIRDGEFVS